MWGVKQERGLKNDYSFNVRLKHNSSEQEGYILKYLEQDKSAARALSTEYASRYLESRGIESTSKNVNAFLRHYPLKENCTVEESGFNENYDLITVTMLRKRKEDEDKLASDLDARHRGNHLETDPELEDGFQRLTKMLKPFQHVKARLNDQLRYPQRGKQAEKQDSIEKAEAKNGAAKFAKSRGKLDIADKAEAKNLNLTLDSNLKGAAKFAASKGKLDGVEKADAKIPSPNFIPNSDNQKGKFSTSKSRLDVADKAEAKSLNPDPDHNPKAKFTTSKGKLQRKIMQVWQDWQDRPRRGQSKSREKPSREKEGKAEEGFRLQLNFSIEGIKEKYLFPFNQSFRKRANLMMIEESLQKQKVSRADKQLFFLNKIYQFPFSLIKLEPDSIKNLQRPVAVSLRDLTGLLHEFCSRFPRSVIPVRADKGSGIAFTNDQVDEVFETVRCEHNARLVGLLCHLGYWVVFGKVNPIEVDNVAKKQIYMLINEIMEYFALRMAKKRKLWILLCQPLLILSFKMLTEFIFTDSYRYFFEEASFSPVSPGAVALAKLFFLIENIFDPNNLFGRLVFIETEKADLGEEHPAFHPSYRHSIFDRKYLRKRIYATSPILNFLLPNPHDGKARSLLAKKEYFEVKEGIKGIDQFEEESDPEDSQLDACQLEARLHEKESRVKMFEVVLKKMQARLRVKLGKNNVFNVS